MALETTLMGFPYPEASDHTRTWEWWQGLAERLETIWTAELGLEDLNTITRPGVYLQTSRTNADPVRNYPPKAKILGDTGVEGFLEVVRSVSGSHIMQRYNEAHPGIFVVWQRIYAGGNWGLWYPIGGPGDWTLGPVAAGPNVTGLSAIAGSVERGVNRAGSIGFMFTWTGASITTDSAGNFGDQLLFTITSPDYRPPRDFDVPVIRSGVSTFWARINSGGDCYLTHGSFPGQTFSTSTEYRIRGDWGAS